MLPRSCASKCSLRFATCVSRLEVALSDLNVVNDFVDPVVSEASPCFTRLAEEFPKSKVRDHRVSTRRAVWTCPIEVPVRRPSEQDIRVWNVLIGAGGWRHWLSCFIWGKGHQFMNGIASIIYKPFAYFTMVNYMLGHQVALGSATNDISILPFPF